MAYLRPLKAILVTALKRTFDGNYPVENLRELHVSIEYPIKPQEYPSVWVNFEEATLQNSGIAHYETGEDGVKLWRWRFSGHVTYTVAAMSSLERDRIYDELVKIVAFGYAAEHLSAFREQIENNDLIAVNFDFDQLDVVGDAAQAGTPWETDEMIYERSLVMQAMGEFVINNENQTLYPLSKIIIDAREVGSEEETPSGPLHWEIDQNASDAPSNQPFNFGEWH